MVSQTKSSIDEFSIDEYSTSQINQGGQARIFVVNDKRMKMYGAKVYESSDLIKEESAFQNEKQSLVKLGEHQNIIKMKTFSLQGIFLNNNCKSVKPYILLEYCQFGSLFNIISKQRLKESIARFIFIKVLEGLNYCHINNIYHFDIKPDNILIKEKKGQCLIKIADFGLSKEENSAYYRGSEGYQTPQIFLNQKATGIQADMFGLGILLFMMVRGARPFRSASFSDELYDLLINQPNTYWKQYERKQSIFSESCKNLIEGMLAFKVEKRLCSYDQIREHDWCKGELSTDAEVLEELIRVTRIR